MTCSRRSTTWCASRALLAACVLGLGAAPGAADAQEAAGAGEAAVRQAIVEAVKSRMGPDADVRIGELMVNEQAVGVPADATLVARPEPGARLARAIRFALSRRWNGGTRTAGYALATIYVATPHARAVRAIDRGETVQADDVIAQRSEVGPVPLQRLPRAADVVGTRALREVAADEVLTRGIVGVKPAVRSGDVVAVRAREAGVTVQTQGVATQSGGVGETIRVVNPASRRRLKARVVAPGEVEVVQ